ncbi:Phosphate:acyl-ACP acyltransferase PlsX [Bathymodiolus heckerae thiotrophic gill symbiont]|uniref:phosphate acyltransferase PlsX n=1 Tax=Bathymodiolus heckerae thiotrophic gill symbiont TaxID=1052212 RepID=UPI0010B0E694|nr:phosphate acyltransferase PlsX [Bathymodiolus heckerae thiotrophic gill symbiont]SMN12850.1 Phosphate:acyl-ACP acyltransferase PlsX [Bathymodiolus heckerae thiotrophic gill symbiont]
MTIKVSIDASGGDRGIPTTVAAGIKALIAFSDLHLVFVGDKSSIQAEFDKNISAQKHAKRFSIAHASEVVAMCESPSTALRKKKDSSMRVAINLVKDNSVDACVSAGNTGALMAISRFVLKTIKGVDRPAIMGRMPTMNGHTHMLDLGANVDSKPEALLEFAVMGSIAVKYTENIALPTVGLLNIGEEEMKGNDKIKQTAELLKASDLNYVGFVEGDDIYKGTVDLVVCDGFEGNIALKASEGVASMMGHYLKQAFTKNIFTKLIALIATPVLKDFKASLNPGKYNGASLLGLRGVVVKSHGGADVDSFFQAIKEAYLEVQAKITEKITKQVGQQTHE